MYEKIEEVIGFIESNKELLEAADGLKPIEFLSRMSETEMLNILAYIRLRYIVEQQHYNSNEEEEA